MAETSATESLLFSNVSSISNEVTYEPFHSIIDEPFYVRSDTSGTGYDEFHVIDEPNTLYFNIYDDFNLLDRTPDLKFVDFRLGKFDDYDKAYDWLIPFGMKVDWRSSSIQYMPQVQHDYVEIPDVDGSLMTNSLYKNRVFNIVAFSELGLTHTEKEKLKKKVVKILDATKEDSKEFAFVNSDIVFTVKYAGFASIVEGPSYIKAYLPFETTPYGHRMFENKLEGSGLIVNNGDEKVGCVHKIIGLATDPVFLLGKIYYKWTGTIPENNTLVIDHENLTCYLEDSAGTKTNALSQLSGDFQTIPKHSSIVLTAGENTKSNITTYIQEKFLWN